MEIIIVVAYAENRVIGRNGTIPWRISEDMLRFRNLTMNHPVIMGRKTYESIPVKFKPLPQRTNIVLSRSSEFNPGHGIIISKSLKEAIERGGEIDKEVYIIGGQNVYEQVLPLASRIYATEIKGNYNGDAYFPDFNRKEWDEIKRDALEGYSFVDYKRKI